MIKVKIWRSRKGSEFQAKKSVFESRVIFAGMEGGVGVIIFRTGVEWYTAPHSIHSIPDRLVLRGHMTTFGEYAILDWKLK